MKNVYSCSYYAAFIKRHVLGKGGGGIIYRRDFQTQYCIKLTDDIGIFVQIDI